MFGNLPDEIKEEVCTYLEPTNLKNMSMTSATNYKLIKFFGTRTENNILPAYPESQNLKTLPDTADYYAIGPMIKVSESSTIFDKGYPYPKARKSIPDSEIKKAVPQSGEIKLFRTQKEAQEYAGLTAYGEFATVDHRSVVFHVTLKNSIESPIIREQIAPSFSFLGLSDKTVEYVVTDVGNLNFISGQIGSSKEVSFQENQKEPCLVM
ncbi:hypothetical protein DIZ81_13275 [Legionella taurinensis]|uniref:F-box domain-containing protein n=2 Tax=Legionella taurinensis TaxID=70611 RepID=A0A3A5L6W7_9GAMM|nr:hypothetical protein [Legionella taurinensis]PUT38742.1 hypothetical protein DB744_13285 [Legionella taurinensis]PUT40121.1 hypothetical protein DB746_12685 [Legionella taurinensis]PUT42273.1 hypothetical protein DB743_13170 [Legionella taurinensis]PUT46045.1 hypothetical protein DB745_12140 [Legionella taurinensis]RJT48799.1 F-box domain-containing protein [Legionella taurinensis]